MHTMCSWCDGQSHHIVEGIIILMFALCLSLNTFLCIFFEANLQPAYSELITHTWWTVCSNDSLKPGNLQRVWYPLRTTNFQNIVVGVLCFLEIKLATLSHYTVIAIQVFAIAHVSPKQIETLCQYQLYTTSPRCQSLCRNCVALLYLLFCFHQWTPLDWATQLRYEAVVALLKRAADPNMLEVSM